MLSSIKIQNLKSIDSEILDLKNLNILAGMNSSGKSTIIQAILMVIQNISNAYTDPLNGMLVSLGEFSEVKNYNKHTRQFSVCLKEEESFVEITFDDIDGSIQCKSENNSENLLAYLNYHNKHINYLSSNRIGGQDLYNKNYENSHMFGINGEYSVDYFEKNKNNQLHTDLILKNDYGYTLDGQLNYWLKEILDTEIRTESIAGTDKVKLSYYYGNSLNNSRNIRPKNIGAGLSYVISILIAALSATPGDLLLIENPEIQLHPKAQSKLTDFLSFVSSKGIQMIIETHSDHVFNGVRKGILRGTIKKEQVAMYFFKINDNYNSMISRVFINDSGVVENNIIGLFDQFDDDLDELLGLKL